MSSPYADDPIAEPILDVLPAEPAPLSEERIGALDLIRGITILGILPVNMVMYMGPTEGLTPVSPPVQWAGDHSVAAGILFFFSAKMITQLAILFGAGLAIQGLRADAAGRPFAGYYAWRMILLLFIGLAHALFLWWGDILVSYAFVGLAALALRPLSVRALLWCMAGFLTWHYLFVAGAMTLTMLAPAGAADQNLETNLPGLAYYMSPDNERRIYLQGPWSEMVINRALHVAMLLFLLFLWLFWYLLACFLLGMCLLRQGVFQDVEAHRTLLRRLVLFGLGVGVPLHLVAVFLYLRNPVDQLAGLVNMAGALPQALAYLALAILWHHSGRLPRVQARFQAVGRMALTNYLMQSVICGFLFYGYGLGWFGRFGHTAGFAVTVSIWTLELTWSPIWLRYFTMGPVEWLWRSLADGRPRPFLRPAAS